MAITYLDSPDRVRAALSPVRRDLLKRQRTARSAGHRYRMVALGHPAPAVTHGEPDG